MPKGSFRGREYQLAEHGFEVLGWAEARGWEHLTFDFLDKALTPSMTFIDIGAWIGLMSLYAQPKCKKVVSVEPDPVAFKTLWENFDGGELHQIAIAGHTGAVTLGSGMLGASTTRRNLKEGNSIGAAEVSFLADCVTLPEFAEKYPDPLCIKIDSEGMEEEILSQSLDFLEKRKPSLFVELHPFWWTSGTMDGTLEALSRIYPRAERKADYFECHA